MPSASMFQWYDIPGVLVYLAWWFGVALVIAAAGIVLHSFRSGPPSDRLFAGISLSFLVVEALLLTSLHLQPNMPDWYERMFIFNGFALPAQLLCIAALPFTAGATRSRWLVAGSILSVASLPVVIPSAIAATRAALSP